MGELCSVALLLWHIQCFHSVPKAVRKLGPTLDELHSTTLQV